MGRGQGKATDLANNGKSIDFDKWEKRTYLDGSLQCWKSTVHSLEVVPNGNGFRISVNGMHLRGKGHRPRTFKNEIMAMIAADQAPKPRVIRVAYWAGKQLADGTYEPHPSDHVDWLMPDGSVVSGYRHQHVAKGRS